MATNAQRWQAICDGLLNRTATTDEMGRLGTALAHGPDAAEYAAMTNGEKVAYAVFALRRHLLAMVKDAEGEAAELAARDAAAATVDTDFTETP